MKGSMPKLLRLLGAAAVILWGTAALAQEPPKKPKILKPCSQCHAPDEKMLRGTIGNISAKAETFAVNTGAIWTVKFDDNTKVSGWPELAKIPKDKEIAVSYLEKDGGILATKVSVKQPAVIPPDKLMSTDSMISHVQQGDAFIVDSRPAARFYEGAIPGAINIYDAEFDKQAGKLPTDKGKLIVFYCAGPT